MRRWTVMVVAVGLGGCALWPAPGGSERPYSIPQARAPYDPAHMPPSPSAVNRRQRACETADRDDQRRCPMAYPGNDTEGGD